MLSSLGNNQKLNHKNDTYDETEETRYNNHKKFITIAKSNQFSSVIYTIGAGYKIVQNSLSIRRLYIYSGYRCIISSILK